MGFKLEIDGYGYELTGFSVEEAATPLAAGDSTGQVGTLTFSVLKPTDGFDKVVNDFGAHLVMNKQIKLFDTRKGFTIGRVKAVDIPPGPVFSITCNSRLGELNIFNVQAQPFIGSLEDAFEYYCSLANVNSGVFVDPIIAARPVVLPGFSGELWYNMKQLAVAIDADISLVSGNIILRPIRVREAVRGRDTDRRMSVGGSLAQSIQIYHYANKQITNKLVYPPDGWNEEVVVYNVNAGESIEVDLELSASVSSIQQPSMQTFVAREYESSSVFTIVGDDGLPVQPSAWQTNGGMLSLEINPDTTSLKLKITAATGLPNKDGEEIGVYSVSLSSEESTGRYSTLRIIGSGVQFKKELLTIPTGVPASQTGTEVGTTIDNPFISTLNDAYSAGSRAAKRYTGQELTLTGSVIAVNQLGDSGQVVYPSYQFDQNAQAGKTYQQVQTSYSGTSYQQVQNDLFALVQDDFENQVFGNVNGARIYDKQSKRWYRIRDASLAPDTISYSADDDLMYEDVRDMWFGNTYQFVQTFYGNYSASYEQSDLMGLVLNDS